MVRFENKDPLMLARQLPIKSVALILAGGRGSRLKDLTSTRAKPAVHFGGKFRIIDFALSNCLNSGIRRIGVITQYQSHTLVQHIRCRPSNASVPSTGTRARRMRCTRTWISFAVTTPNMW